jgi:hypothetical protein
MDRRGYAIILLAAIFVGRAVCFAGGEEAKRISQWIDDLQKAEVKGQRDAADALGKLGFAGKPAVPALAAPAVSNLVVLLRTGNELERSAALRALRHIGAMAKDAIPDIRAALHDERVGQAAVHTLGAIGPDAVPALIDGLTAKDGGVRRRAGEALRELGPAAKSAVSALSMRPGGPEWPRHGRQSGNAA